MSDTNFEITEKEVHGATHVKVIVDKETGVNYLFVQRGYSGGLSVRVDADGKPIITK